MRDPGAWLVPLTDTSCRDSKAVGGKASQLHALLDAGFNVPPAWVITNDAFCAHFPDALPAALPPRPDLEDRLQDQLPEVWDSLSAGGTHDVVVRSSALGEDGLAHSFAGQHATYYYIDEQNLSKAIVDCWLSLWSTAALT